MIDAIRYLMERYGCFSGDVRDMPEENLAAYTKELGELMASFSGQPGTPKECTVCGTLSECSPWEEGVLLWRGQSHHVQLCVDCGALQFTDNKEFFRRLKEKLG